MGRIVLQKVTKSFGNTEVIPPLDLTVVATPQTNLENLVQEQIRSSIRRRGVWSLVGLITNCSGGRAGSWFGFGTAPIGKHVNALKRRRSRGNSSSAFPKTTVFTGH